MSVPKSSPDFDLTQDEAVSQTVRVWAFDARYLWIIIPVIFLIYFSPIVIWLKLIFGIVIIWLGSYTVTQKWRLTLTNKRITARQLYPWPLTYLSRSYHFPYKHIEGLSLGPKTNITFFLFGLALLNIGINMIKASFSTVGLDLPDTLEFLIFLLRTSQLFSSDGDTIEQTATEYYTEFAGDLFLIFGVLLFCLGIASILVSYPWRKLLVIRIRYAADFKLRATIKPKFIKEFYSRLYKQETGPPPKKFKKWGYVWLKDERVENVADLEQTLYGSIVIGLFALFTGSYRIWRAVETGDIQSSNFFFWIAVSFLDLIIIILSIKYSKRTNEMVITNKRIIFAQEIYQVSGVLGKRHYFIADLRRKDISGFEFKKAYALAIQYFLLGIFLFGIAILMVQNGITILPIFLYIIGLFFLFLVNQTFLGFSLQTKSGDKWIMRHYLASPFSRLRSFIGDETRILSVLLSNRLEEREIINSVQILRATQFQLKPKLFEKRIKKELKKISHFRQKKKEEEGISQSAQTIHESELGSELKLDVTNLPKSARLSLDDLLLVDEKIEWRKDIAYPLRSKKLSLIFGTIMYVVFSSFMFSAAIIFEFELNDDILSYGGFNTPLAISGIAIMIFVYILMLLKYYSFRRMSIIITKKRIFFEEVRLPPKWLFILGFFRYTFIRETLIDQLQTLKMKRNLIHNLRANNFTDEIKRGLRWLILFFILIYVRLELIYRYYKELNYDGSENLVFKYIITIMTYLIIYVSLQIGWNFSSAAVEFVQAWPTILMDAEGIKMNFPLPYLNLHQAQSTQFLIWSGTSSRSRLKYLTERKKLRRMRGDQHE